MATLGGGEIASGEGESVKVRRCGKIGNGGGDSCALRMAEDRGRGGDLAGAGKKECEDVTGVATPGSSWLGNLGRPGAGLQD